MKENMKAQNLLRLLPLVLLLSLPAIAQAQFKFTTNADNTITITQYTGPNRGTVIVPGVTNGLPVTSIGDFTFSGDGGVNNVTLPDSISSIGMGAFTGCVALTNVTIGNNVCSIGQGAFYNCRLTSFTVPDTVTNLGSSAFYRCLPLTNVTIGSGLTSIGQQSFYQCLALSSVLVGNRVSSVGQQAFLGCISLTNLTLPSSLTNIGLGALSYCSNLADVYFMGNKPALGSSVFLYDSNVTVYYFPETTGWNQWVAPPPAVLWNPQPQGPTVQTNQFGFTITGTADIPIAVVACTNPANQTWAPLQTCTLTNGSIYFSDPDWTNYPARYYRIRSP
jgi:hypothetical protein